MIRLSQLPKIITRGKKRLGRGFGSGVGAKSTRGTSRHQAARETIPIHFEGGQNKLIKKLPLLVGKGKNRSYKLKPLIVRISQLAQFPKDTQIYTDLLIEKKLVSRNAHRRGVKIAADSDSIKVALHVMVKTTRKAKDVIEKAGGTVSSNRL